MMPIRRPQKEKELLLFEQFNELLELGATNIKQPEPPDPDIFALVNNKRIGVEISELYSDNINKSTGSTLARHQSIREKVLELAIRKVEKTIDFPFQLHVSYNRNEILNEDMLPLSNEIARIITEQLKDLVPTKEWKIITIDNNNYNLNLSRVTIYVSNNLKRHIYSPVAASWVPHLIHQNIENAICIKESKIPNYIKNCGEIWLLLVELGDIASSFDNVEEALNMKYQTEFNRIYFLRSLYKKVLEIKISG